MMINLRVTIRYLKTPSWLMIWKKKSDKWKTSLEDTPLFTDPKML